MDIPCYTRNPLLSNDRGYYYKEIKGGKFRSRESIPPSIRRDFPSDDDDNQAGLYVSNLQPSSDTHAFKVGKGYYRKVYSLPGGGIYKNTDGTKSDEYEGGSFDNGIFNREKGMSRYDLEVRWWGHERKGGTKREGRGWRSDEVIMHSNITNHSFPCSLLTLSLISGDCNVLAA